MVSCTSCPASAAFLEQIYPLCKQRAELRSPLSQDKKGKQRSQHAFTPPRIQAPCFPSMPTHWLLGSRHWRAKAGTWKGTDLPQHLLAAAAGTGQEHPLHLCSRAWDWADPGHPPMGHPGEGCWLPPTQEEGQWLSSPAGWGQHPAAGQNPLVGFLLRGSC